MEPTIENIEHNETPTLISKGYQFLRQLCSFEADFNAFRRGATPITNRVQYIITQLTNHNIAHEVEMFKAIAGVPTATLEDTTNCYVNVVVMIEGVNTELTTVFLAHHDVSNTSSENCQDNTASVANLLDLAVRLSKNKPENNVVIAFVDAEEIVSPPICGAQKLGQNIISGKYGQVKYAVNLELTANGRNYWFANRIENLLSRTIRERQPETKKVSCPYNDAFVLEMLGLSSVCIGSLNDGNMNQVATRGYCSTWSMCHSMADTFDSQAVEDDMDLFVNYLETLI